MGNLNQVELSTSLTRRGKVLILGYKGAFTSLVFQFCSDPPRSSAFTPPKKTRESSFGIGPVEQPPERFTRQVPRKKRRWHP